MRRLVTVMADQEDHRTEDEILPHHGEHELHVVADTVTKAVASSMQEALQPLLRLIPSALATPLPSTATTGDKSKKAPPPDDSTGTSGKCLLARRRSALARYIMGRTKFTTSGAHDLIAITSSQKNDLCTEELRDRAKSLDGVSLPLRKASLFC